MRVSLSLKNISYLFPFSLDKLTFWFNKLEVFATLKKQNNIK